MNKLMLQSLKLDKSTTSTIPADGTFTVRYEYFFAYSVDETLAVSQDTPNGSHTRSDGDL